MHRHQRPAAASSVVDGMKLHYRRVRLDGRDYTVITPRPGTLGRFATNRYHQTWHVLSDWHGARMLGRLLWGLAYQRRPGTLVLIQAPFLDPNPFDAAPSCPIALVPATLTPWREPLARRLRRVSLAGPGDGTVRWRTPGLDGAVTEQRVRSEMLRAGKYWQMPHPWQETKGPELSVRMVGGVLTFAAGPDALRELAVSVFTLGDHPWHGMDYTQIGPWPHEGEVQVFADYHRRVAAARLAREEVLAEVAAEALANPSAERRSAEVVERLIWNRGTEIRRRPLGPVPGATDPAANPAPTPAVSVA